MEQQQLVANQVDPLYGEARDYTSLKTDTRDIEMMPNVVYGSTPLTDWNILLQHSKSPNTDRYETTDISECMECIFKL